MKAKKIYFLTIAILLIILSIILWSYFNRDEEVINESNEIVPEQEISDEQLRNTIISLYYINDETGEIEVENKLIDVKKIMTEPYKELVNLWLEGPKNNKLKNNCSKNVKINSTKLMGDCVIIDFNKSFIEEYSGKENEEIKTINCLVKTLTELNEVNSVKILIDGEENKYLGNFNLSEKYLRVDN